jgi:hypothetical protein
VVRPLFVDRKQKLGIVLNWLQLGICLIWISCCLGLTEIQLL